MKISLLKWCYAIEIGAYLAYQGHFKVTGDKNIRKIAKEELEHMIQIEKVLADYKTKPNPLFNVFFLILGNIIILLCKITPAAGLNLVARVMEKFNIVSYRYMAEKFPAWESEFLAMMVQEHTHELYFSGKVRQ